MGNKKKVVALAGAAAVLAIGGTFAYFNQTLTVTNEFDTGTYDTELVEKFKPSDGNDWEPGATVNKDVLVSNNGSLPVVVRVKFQEIWDRDGEVFYDIDTVEDLDVTALGTLPDGVNNKFENIYQEHPFDGSDDPDGVAGTDAAGNFVDDSVVKKGLILDDGWIYNPDDGYYYYQYVLDGYQENADGTVTVDQTSLLLDYVTLIENVDMGAYDVIKYYSTETSTPSDASGWTEFDKNGDDYLSTKDMNEILAASGDTINFMKSATEIKDGLLGYSDADYTLVITAQTVQATTHAVEEVFKHDNAYFTSNLGCSWDLTDEDVVQTGTTN